MFDTEPNNIQDYTIQNSKNMDSSELLGCLVICEIIVGLVEFYLFHMDSHLYIVVKMVHIAIYPKLMQAMDIKWILMRVRKDQRCAYP